MKQPFIIIQIVTAIVALANGLVCFTRPSQAIKIQQKFYEKINWKLEPINLPKELRNTKIMGLLSIILAILIIVVLISKW